MALSNKFCKWDSTMDLYTDKQGNILTKGDVIFCKKQPFVVTEGGYIDWSRGQHIPSPRLQAHDTSGKGKESNIGEK